jgi:thiamine biosynthesis protein ThiI
MLYDSGNNIKIRTTEGRYYVTCPDEKSGFAEDVFSRLFGITGWAKTMVCKKTEEEIIKTCVKEGIKITQAGVKTFKINARRTDKSFPLNSYELCCKAGDAVTSSTIYIIPMTQ